MKGRTGEILELVPKDLLNEIKNSNVTENTVGCSASGVYKVENEERTAYLKIREIEGISELGHEKNILEWLEGRLPVPKVLRYSEKNGIEYLLISEIEGIDAHDPSMLSTPKKTVPLIAQGLKTIHSLDITGCPFDLRLENRLRNALFNVENDLVDTDDFQPSNKGRSPEEMYSELVEKKPATEDLVFTHGDYCLPNIKILGGKVNGFVDLGRAGVSDRYQDIALALRSIVLNFETRKWSELFLESYGISNADADKLEYYVLLDELF